MSNFPLTDNRLLTTLKITSDLNATTDGVVAAFQVLGGGIINKDLRVKQNLIVDGSFEIGSIVVTGDAEIKGNAEVEGELDVLGEAAFDDAVTVSDTLTADSLIGTIGAIGTLTVTSALRVSTITAQDGRSALTIAEDGTGDVTIDSTTGTTSGSTGALVVAGGVGIQEDLYVDNDVTVGGTLTAGTISFTNLTVETLTATTAVQTNTIKSESGTDALTIGDGTGLVSLALNRLEMTTADYVLIGNDAGNGAALTGSVVVGTSAGGALTSGTHNTLVGSRAGTSLKTHSNNTLIGFQAGEYNANGNNTFVGNNAGRGSSGNSAGTENTIIGTGAGVTLEDGDDNVLIGFQAANVITDGTSNCAIGHAVAGALTTGSRNVLFGAVAGDALTTDVDNTMLGYQSGRYVASSNNTFVGKNAGRGDSGGASGDENVFMGKSAGEALTTGSTNVVIGFEAANVMTTGELNVLIGGSVCSALTIGTRNVVLGYTAASALSSGTHNVMIGNNVGDALTIGTNNVFIGRAAGSAVVTGLRNVVIGEGSGGSLSTSATDQFLLETSQGTLMSGDFSTGVVTLTTLAIGTIMDATSTVNAITITDTTGIVSVVQGLSVPNAATIGSINTGTINASDGTSAIGIADTTGNVTIETVCSVTDTTGSTGTSSGAFTVGGGVGIAENLFVGGTGNFAGVTSVTDSTGSTSTSSGALVVSGGVGIAENLFVGAKVYAGGADIDKGDFVFKQSGDASSNALAVEGSTGSLPNSLRFFVDSAGSRHIWGGGNGDETVFINDATVDASPVGGGGEIHMGGVTEVLDTTETTGTADGALVVSGGAYIAKKLHVQSSIITMGSSSYTIIGNSAGAGQNLSRTVIVGGVAGANLDSSRQWNTMVGYAAGRYADGDANTLFGHNAGSGSSTYSVDNLTALGYDAGRHNTISNNVYVGYGAGTSASGAKGTGSANTCVGYQTGNVLTSGGDNTFLGDSAGVVVTTGDNNTLIGSAAGDAITTGADNVCLGTSAGSAVVTADNNTFIGSSAGVLATGGSNVALGYSSGTSLTSGDFNVFLGREAGNVITTGTGNVAIGYKAGAGFTDITSHQFALATLQGELITGNFNTQIVNIVGETDASSTTTGTLIVSGGVGIAKKLFVGDTIDGKTLELDPNSVSGGALIITNTATQSSSSLVRITGEEGEKAIDINAGTLRINDTTDTTGSSDGSIATDGGVYVAKKLYIADTTDTTGSTDGSVVTNGGAYVAKKLYVGGNVIDMSSSNYLFIGNGAGNGAETRNLAIGENAGAALVDDGVDDGVNNTLIGYQCGEELTTGDYNTFLGDRAGRYNTGSYSVIIGQNAGLGSSGSSSGGSNTIIGYQSGLDIETGDQNVMLGYNAGSGVIDGGNNVFIGANTGALVDTSDIVAVGSAAGRYNTGSANVFIGKGAGKGVSGSSTGYSNTIIGYQSGTALTTGYSNTYYGYYAGNVLTTGIRNTFIGRGTAANIQSGNYNVCLGYQAGSQLSAGDDYKFVLESGTAGGGGNRLMDGDFTSGSRTLHVYGTLSKDAGSFKIDHPLEEKKETHHLVHSFIEGPKADLIYRGKVALVDGRAEIDIDVEAGMTAGTFCALCRDVQCFTSNETSWTNVRGRVMGNVLTVEAQDSACTDVVSWMVIGERKDATMRASTMTDDDGNVIVEPAK